MALRTGTATVPTMVKVWDPLVRILHWTLALACIANLSVLRDADESHEYVGYAALAAVAIRILWGVIGSQHARFGDFIPGPRRLVSYCGELMRGREPRYLGHNPAGAVMMMLLVFLVAIVGLSGWMMGTDRFWGVEWVETLHEMAANLIFACAVLHVMGAVVESVRHRENLILSMITGRKRAPNGSDVIHAPMGLGGQ
jgi:cytochrome b